MMLISVKHPYNYSDKTCILGSFSNVFCVYIVCSCQKSTDFFISNAVAFILLLNLGQKKFFMFNMKFAIQSKERKI